MSGWTWPSAPHDPTEREILGRLGDWQFRAFADHDERALYLLRRGMAHLQIWHPTSGVSFLTPSRLSCGLWELDIPGPARRRFRLSSLDDIDSVLCADRLPLTPDPDWLRAAHEAYVLEPARRILLLGGLGSPYAHFPEA